MKRALLFLSVVGIMVYGAILSFNYDTRTASSSPSGSAKVQTKQALGSTISGVVIPESDSKGSREEFLKALTAKAAPKRIVITAGFEASEDAEIKIYPGNWTTNNGELVNDKEVFDNITAQELARSDTELFQKSETLPAILSELYDTFPNSVYTILLIPTAASSTSVQSLANLLVEGDSEAMIIALSDFATGLPPSLAKVHNTAGAQSLMSQKIDGIMQIDSSSPQSLLLASEFSKGVEAGNFHQNANDLLAPSGYFDKQSDSMALAKSTSFIIAGDAMFDRNVWHNYKDTGLDKIFSNLPANIFRGTDLSLLNLEGPISAKEIDDDYKSGSMVFNFPPVVPQILKDLGIKAVSLANNHSSNAGSAGFANTQKMLKNADISYFGRQNGFDADEDIFRFDGGVKLSIIAVDALANYSEKDLLANIKKEKAEGRFVMVFPHWGEEYKTVHNASQKALATKWIAAGAGLIIGSHPHVVQDFEVVNGAPVVYSLGNFVFDQFFSEDTQRGLMVAINITDAKISLSFLPTKEVVVKPELLKGLDKSAAIDKVFDIDSAAGFTKVSDDTIEISR